jgi:hypothetical protein
MVGPPIDNSMVLSAFGDYGETCAPLLHSGSILLSNAIFPYRENFVYKAIEGCLSYFSLT